MNSNAASRLRRTVLGAALVAATLAACSSSNSSTSSDSSGTTASPTSASSTAADVVEVHVRAFQFVPATVEVPEGATLRFVNDDATTHTVTMVDGGPSPAFDLVLDGKGSTGDLQLAAGTYRFACARHPQMTGEIVVG